LKPKGINEIDYNNKKIFIDTFEARIMDFEKSKIDKNLELINVVRNIEKLFDSVKNNDKCDIQFNYKNEMIRELKNKITMENINAFSVNKTHYNELESIIESFYIE
jgi:hypothetical protein